MVTRHVKIEDKLFERIEAAKDEIEEVYKEYAKANPDVQPEEIDLWNDLDYDGSVSAIIDLAVPIYTSEIRDLWYLYGDKFEDAYEVEGVGYNPRENFGMVAIYLYIQQEISDWYDAESLAELLDMTGN